MYHYYDENNNVVGDYERTLQYTRPMIKPWKWM